ncbi:MAG: trypsin-like peptidase domain-containing protein [Patescibacteria group bacterium]
MKSEKETWVIVMLCLAVFFGSLSGGVTAILVSGTTGIFSAVGRDLVGALSEQAGLQALQAEEQATIAVVQSVTPSVVSILIEETALDGQRYEVGGGTGFFVSADGLILTNKHVVSDDVASYVVVTSDGVEHDATVLAKDLFLDLAVVKIDGSDYQAVSLGDSDALKIGQTVIAIGNSLAEFENSATKGIISGIDRTITAGSWMSGDEEVIEQAIQTDAAINQGNSGGPLINLKSEVIGINTAISVEGQSLGFAIPINVAKSVISDVIAEGRIVRPWLGVRYSMIDKELKQEFDLTESQGALIMLEDSGSGDTVIDGSPADKAGLKPGDVIIFVDGVALSNQHSLGIVINQYDPGDVIVLLIHRDGQEQTISVTLEEVDTSKL